MSKQALFNLLDRPIAFQRIFVDVTGCITGALMLSQAVYWSKRTSDPEGWFYKTGVEWEEETGMGRYEQESARQRLRMTTFWAEKKEGLPAKLYYKVDLDKLFQAIMQGEIPVTMEQVLKEQKKPLADASKAGRMRSQKHGAVTEYVDYALVLQKYGMVCSVCKEPITRGMGHETGSLSFDHFVSLKEGGSHTFDNMRPAHLGCNCAKRAEDSSYDTQASLLSHSKLASYDKATKRAVAQQTGALCDNNHSYTESTTENTTKTTTTGPVVVVVASALEETKASASKANGAVFELWQNNMPGSLTPLIVEQLNDAINTYGAFEVDNAIRIAVGNGKRNMRYVQGILDKRAAGQDSRSPSDRTMQSSGEFLGENKDSYNHIPSGGKIMQPHEIVWKG